ncbi:MAG: sulfatase-like hydrolase/transferase [Lachnospiraceae bacterium]|nr:sulfatase-like hydrolase/transferase [Lachnospiraceae bacterium]
MKEHGNESNTIRRLAGVCLFAALAAVFIFLVINRNLFLGAAAAGDSASEADANRGFYFAAALAFPLLAMLHFLAVRTVFKRKKGEESSLLRKMLVALFAAFNSFASFYFIELLYNPDLYQMALKFIIIGWGITAAADLILMGLVNSVSIGMMIGNVFFMALGLTNYFVLQFRSIPFQFIDLFAAGTALSVAPQYTFRLTWQMALMFSFLISAASVYSSEGAVRIFTKLPLKIFLRAAAVGLGGICFYVFFRTSFFTDQGMWFANFNPQSSYVRFGMEACFLGYAKLAQPSVPEGYSAEKVEEIIAAAKDEANDGGGAGGELPENIIVIMNESFSDLSIYPGLQTTEEVMPYFNSLTENAQKGPLLVSVRGGWTANTEYEFLTGNSCLYSPGTVVYNFFIRDDQYSLARSLKAQGYRTEAVHPYYPGGWNRTMVYKRMAFDEFISIEAFQGVPRTRWCVGDFEDYKKVIRLVEEKEEGEKLFIFNVTMQNHGGYTSDNFDADLHVVGYEGDFAGEADQYLSLIHLSDQALQYLIGYFEKSDEKTLIVFFGDHQPALSDDFLSYALGKDSSEMTFEENQMTYETRYLIWANYDIPESSGERISANYLGEKMLELAGLKETAYQSYLGSLRETIPAVNAFGYETADGSMHEHGSGKDPEAESLLSDYECLIYNELMGGKARDEAFFGLNE